MYLPPFAHAITAPANQINRINPFLYITNDYPHFLDRQPERLTS